MKVRCSLFLAGLLFNLACQTDVELDVPPQIPRLSVYGMLEPDSLATVWISQSRPINEVWSYQAVTNAEVIITPEGEPAQFLQLVDAQRGKYQGGFKPEPGQAYQLSITAEGFPLVSASTQVPNPVPIRQLTYESQRIPGFCSNCTESDSITDYTIDITFADPIRQENYYEVLGWMDYVDEYYVYDSLNDEQPDTIRSLATTELNLRSTNLAFSTVEEAILDNALDRYYYLMILFDDRSFNGEQYTFDVRTVNSDPPTRIKMALRTYHADAYQYERAKDLQDSYAVDALFYEPVQIPMNIRGGYGIFSSFSQDTVVIALDK